MSSPAKTTCPGARLEHAGDQVEEGGLAGAVGTDDGADLAGLHRHVDVVDGDQRAEAARPAPCIQVAAPGASLPLSESSATSRLDLKRLVRMPQMPCGANMTKAMKMVPKISGHRSVTCDS